ncbi:vWA domain-containing protein [Fulvivirga sedimenti]|uniref:VWA domain-containing protein n=1 Tax=Fulvivirga sedimenti TaxID=2879465 RepID=A0A9X1HJM0_9BACT|nr:VWA domain-containing protein [Fulvivirga sedimenti]MCA6073374.1 VWA domain-containing protein [Fulvivirga sedimenti]
MRSFLGLILILALGLPVSGQVTQQIPEKTRILFLLDGSGSMLASWGNTNRITMAKEILSDLVDSLRADRNLELALRVYGHRFARDVQNCTDSKLEIPFSSGNHDRIISRLATIQPKGTTPIAYSLEQSANDFPQSDGFRNIIIIITDGIESCDGDPCRISKELQRKGIFLRPFIIGIGMDETYSDAFECVGSYYDAHDVEQFRVALSRAIETSLKTSTVSVDIQDENGRSNQTNINVSFINAVTNNSDFDFIHYRDDRGRPDSVELDPVVPYHIRVNTVPPVIKGYQQFTPGAHTVVAIQAPRGTLNLRQDGAGVYGPGLKAIIRIPGRENWFHAQDINSRQEYLSGNYDIEFLTLPRTMVRNVEITTGLEKTVEIASPGIVNMDHAAGGFGSVYVLQNDGSLTWVCDINHSGQRMAIALQPGQYRIVFRARMAPGSKYTSVKNITVKEGQSSLIKLF